MRYTARNKLVSLSEGLSAHPLSSTYRNMVHRCHNPNDPRYAQYGGRGIRVCKRWLEPGNQGFLNFIADMGPRPEGRTKKRRPAYSLERVDNNLGYGPDNCRWGTASEQNKNKRFSTLQWRPVEPLRVRCYLVLIGQSSILCNEDGGPWLTKDVYQAKHRARMVGGRYIGLKEFVDRLERPA